MSGAYDYIMNERNIESGTRGLRHNTSTLGHVHMFIMFYVVRALCEESIGMSYVIILMEVI